MAQKWIELNGLPIVQFLSGRMEKCAESIQSGKLLLGTPSYCIILVVVVVVIIWFLFRWLNGCNLSIKGSNIKHMFECVIYLVSAQHVYQWMNTEQLRMGTRKPNSKLLFSAPTNDNTENACKEAICRLLVVFGGVCVCCMCVNFNK